MTLVSRPLALAILLAVAGQGPASAFDLAGTKRIVAHTRDGRDIDLGSVTFKPKGDATSYDLALDMSKFKEFFLSMRQFKCLEGPEIQCYVPYPYPNPHTVTAKDLAWLDHDLLFFFKAPNDYGAKLNNGLFYDLHVTDKGISGKPQAISLDKIASPPADLGTPPFAKDDRDDIPDGARWIESLRIE